MATIHVMVGIPGSGKSTYSRKLSEKLNIKVVSSDNIRDEHPEFKQFEVFKELYRLVSVELADGRDVIIDATNSTVEIRKNIVRQLAPYDIKYDMEAYYFPISYEACYERIVKRNELGIDRYFPLDVLDHYYSSVEAPSREEGYKEIHIIEQVELKDVKEILLKNLVTRNDQGFAFYYGAKNGEVLAQNGTRGEISSGKIDFNTNFRLASVSKQFIGYGIYLLIKNGKLTYDTKLNDIFYIGEYAKDITIKNMLNHTSGLIDYESMEHTDKQISDYDVLEFIKKQDHTYFEVGSRYQYSNTAFVILGLVIEKVSGVKLSDYLDKEVFKKAGMVDTVVNYEGKTLVNRRAYGHLEEDNKLVIRDQYWCSATIGDGGIYSNVNDLVKWLKYLESIYTLDIDFFTPNILENGENTEYALGIRHIKRKGIDIIYHCGSTIGFNTIVGFIPSEEKRFVFLTNLGNHSCDEFLNNLISIL